MKARREDMAKAILKLLKESRSPKAVSRSIATYLIAEKRAGELNSLLRDLESFRFHQDGVMEIHAESAYPLTDDIKDQISQLFAAEKVVIHEEYEKKLLGGVKVRALDRVADFSVQARLRRLRQKGVYKTL